MLEYYRDLLTGVIRQICGLWMRLKGIREDYSVEWENISLQDEVELARARLLNVQADKLAKEISEGE